MSTHNIVLFEYQKAILRRQYEARQDEMLFDLLDNQPKSKDRYDDWNEFMRQQLLDDIMLVYGSKFVWDSIPEVKRNEVTLEEENDL